MNVLIVPNLRKNNAVQHTADVIHRLLELECDCMLGDQFSYVFADSGARFGNFTGLLGEADMIVAIGGDGTIIHAAKDAVSADKPILGINLGRLGFLAQLEVTELQLLEQVVRGEYCIEERMMLKALRITGDGRRERYYAFNDVVLSKGALSRMIDLQVDCEQGSVGHFRADGLIFSTPTGSTAYSMSAGGAILDPVVDGIAMTPICAHTIGSRPLIFSPERCITISQRVMNYTDKLYMTIDGEQAVMINPEDSIEIGRSKKRVKLVTFTHRSFFEILSQKLNYRG